MKKVVSAEHPGTLDVAKKLFLRPLLGQNDQIPETSGDGDHPLSKIVYGFKKYDARLYKACLEIIEELQLRLNHLLHRKHRRLHKLIRRNLIWILLKRELQSISICHPNFCIDMHD